MGFRRYNCDSKVDPIDLNSCVEMFVLEIKTRKNRNQTRSKEPKAHVQVLRFKMFSLRRVLILNVKYGIKNLRRKSEVSVVILFVTEKLAAHTLHCMRCSGTNDAIYLLS